MFGQFYRSMRVSKKIIRPSDHIRQQVCPLISAGPSLLDKIVVLAVKKRAGFYSRARQIAFR